MTKWATVVGAAVLVVLIARQVRAAANWDYLPGYKPGSGYYA